LLKNIADGQRITPLKDGKPTPDDLDELITKVWKEPAFFLAHPRAIAAFERECTRRGVPPVTVALYGGTFITWRGIPFVPTDKLFVDGVKKTEEQDGQNQYPACPYRRNKTRSNRFASDWFAKRTVKRTFRSF